MARKRGKDLKIGDTIKVWWASAGDTIIKLDPFDGLAAKHFRQGAQIAYFALGKSEMTIDNHDFYEVIDQ